MPEKKSHRSHGKAETSKLRNADSENARKIQKKAPDLPMLE
jgi:hypothetical protein